MRQGRSAVRTLLLERADKDREIMFFPEAPFSTSPYASQNAFSPAVRSACASNLPLTSGLRICKAIILGDASVGKTCLVNRFSNREFDAFYKATIGVDFEVERFDILQMPFNLQLWDTAGQERFRCIASSYYRAAHAIVLVFDVTRPMSLTNCTEWLREALDVNTQEPRPFVFLVATKKDLLSPEAYTDIEIKALKLAMQMGAEFWSVSARSGENVNEFFCRLAALTFDAAILREIEICSGPQIGTQFISLDTSKESSKRKERKGCEGSCFH